MGKFDDALNAIQRGKQGLNKGLPMGFDRLVEYLPNTQQKTFYLVGAGTKVGKTSFADDCFLYNPFEYLQNAPDSNIIMDVDYFSYEIDSTTKIIKAITRKLWKDYGLVLDVNTILSRGNKVCTEEIYRKVVELRDYFAALENMLTVHDIPEHPTAMNMYLMDKAERYGKVYKKNIGKDKHGIDIIKFDKYIPSNPNRYWIIIIDHIALMKEERGFNTKQNIDKMSQYLVQLRNNFNAIPVVIQQLTFDKDNDDRFSQKRLTPILRDFGDSKYTTRDANVILTLFNPSAYDIEDFRGYNIKQLGNSYRNLEILANRDGEPNINIGLNFIGPAGTFRELPKADAMTDAHYHKARNYIK